MQKYSNPAKFRLTPEGEQLAQRLFASAAARGDVPPLPGVDHAAVQAAAAAVAAAAHAAELARAPAKKKRHKKQPAAAAAADGAAGAGSAAADASGGGWVEATVQAAKKTDARKPAQKRPRAFHAQLPVTTPVLQAALMRAQ